MPRRSSANGTWALNLRAYPRLMASTSSMAFPPTSPGTSATYVDTMTLTHSTNAPPKELLAKGPQIVEVGSRWSIASG